MRGQDDDVDALGGLRFRRVRAEFIENLLEPARAGTDMESGFCPQGVRDVKMGVRDLRDRPVFPDRPSVRNFGWEHIKALGAGQPSQVEQVRPGGAR